MRRNACLEVRVNLILVGVMQKMNRLEGLRNVQLADVAWTLSCTLSNSTFPPSMPSTSTSCLSPFLRFRDVTPLSLYSVAMARMLLLKARVCGLKCRGAELRSVCVRLRTRMDCINYVSRREGSEEVEVMMLASYMNVAGCLQLRAFRRL